MVKTFPAASVEVVVNTVAPLEEERVVFGGAVCFGVSGVSVAVGKEREDEEGGEAAVSIWPEEESWSGFG